MLIVIPLLSWDLLFIKADKKFSALIWEMRRKPDELPFAQ